MDIRELEDTMFINKNLIVNFRSEVFNGKKMDTVVSFNQKDSFVIAGESIDQFQKEFKALIDKYKI